MNDISRFFGSDDEFVSKTTKMAAMTKEYYQSGKITDEEYSNILDNIEKMYEIEKQASSIERKKLLEDIINAVRMVLPLLK